MLVRQCTSTTPTTPARTSIGGRRPTLPGRGRSHCRQPGSGGHVIGRSWPRFPAPDFHRDDCPSYFLGSDLARHFGALSPRGNGLAAFDSRSHALARQFGDMSDRVLVGVTVCGQVIKVGNAGDETAIVLAIDHRPVPD